MAILIRESRVIDGTEYHSLKVFKSDKFPITKQDEQKALALDDYIERLFGALIEETQKNNLLRLKNKPGVIELWYHVGKYLQFVDNSNLVNPSDRKYIWRAIWYHAGLLAPGEMKARAGTQRDHFLYCYRLAKYDFDLVKTAGNWRAWMDFFDSPIVSNDHVLMWFEKNIPHFKALNKRNWLREFLKNVRNRFHDIDMTFLSVKEIQDELDLLFISFKSS